MQQCIRHNISFALDKFSKANVDLVSAPYRAEDVTPQTTIEPTDLKQTDPIALKQRGCSRVRNETLGRSTLHRFGANLRASKAGLEQCQHIVIKSEVAFAPCSASAHATVPSDSQSIAAGTESKAAGDRAGATHS
jgi:hypothetical protein